MSIDLTLDLSSLGHPDATIRLPRNYTLGHVLLKVRRMFELRPEIGLFLMVVRPDGREDLPAMSIMLSQLGEVEYIKVMKESVFGTLDRRFLKAEIKKKGNSFLASIYYSYYGIYTFVEQEIFDTLELAKEYLLRERCQNMVYIEI